MGKNLPVDSNHAMPSTISLERPEQFHDLLGMPPEFAGASSETKVVQGFAEFHVGLPLSDTSFDIQRVTF